ncbi:hypothetical protein [Candidatus Reidiella endopervernicosa]|uniref:Uncharacterized protein n=1 Tax=Candidatus Reidiella endopervernicosa TaxID=2738883 RepID=A0A6N0HZP6_9GAMM|nr:hypothetical protein [Candidatus Reidiella endopervernicosa]QKQ27799.1 hypothetical protein HUE57_17060 [Candidatus Reidiella endopervernicosa]
MAAGLKSFFVSQSREAVALIERHWTVAIRHSAEGADRSPHIHASAEELVEWIKAREVMKPYKKPSSFDYNLVEVGSAGGLAYIAAAGRRSPHD